jgi:hypothetical protein
VTGSSTLVLGFLLGLRHATEADHLVAVAALATRHAPLSGALRQGLAWGIGHTLTLLLVGSTVLSLGQALPPRFELLLELAVGLMLIGLGGDVLRRHRIERLHHPAARLPPKSLARAPLVGMMHGMAGSAALIALSLGAAASPAAGLLCILLFGLGAMLGMAVLSTLIALPLRLSATSLHRTLVLSIGTLSLGLGLLTTIAIGRQL